MKRLFASFVPNTRLAPQTLQKKPSLTTCLSSPSLLKCKDKGLLSGSSPPMPGKLLVLALDNMGIKTEFHQTDEQAHSLKKQSDSREGRGDFRKRY